MEELEAQGALRTFILALEEAIQEPLSSMLKTYSENSSEAEIPLLDSWTKTMTSSSEILAGTEGLQSKNLKNQISMTHSAVLGEALAVASVDSRALEALELSVALMTTTSLVQVEELFQGEGPPSKHQRSLRMERK